MRILSNTAVLGLIPVPPMPARQDCAIAGLDLQVAAERMGRSSDQPTVTGKWGRLVQPLSLALNGFLMIALAVSPLAASHHCAPEKPMRRLATSQAAEADLAALGQAHKKLLKPVTFAMRPSSASKTAVAALPGLKPEIMAPAPRPQDVVIDVIVAYTGKAAAGYADIRRDLIDLAVEEANASFRASNLGHIKLRLVHAYQTGYVEQGAHFDHVWRFADKGDGHMEEIHGLRDQYRADVAILIVDDAKGCGLATRVEADADEAFAVVHHECAATNYSLAHEIGHLIGARHELGYVNGTKWRDIMSYKDACDGCPRVAVWSSPTVLVNGEPAGTTELDNARIIAAQAPRVAAFR